MEEKNCYICNTITSNEYKVTNDEVYFICSDNCLKILWQMKRILYLIHDLNGKYGRLVPIAEISEIFDGWIRPIKKKSFIKILIDKNFLIKHKHGFVEISKNIYEDNLIALKLK